MGARKYVPLKDRTKRGYCGATTGGTYTEMGRDWILERIKAGDLPARKIPTGSTFKYVTTYDELDLLMDSYMVRSKDLGDMADELVEGLSD
jgi:hypothetical protein